MPDDEKPSLEWMHGTYGLYDEYDGFFTYKWKKPVVTYWKGIVQVRDFAGTGWHFCHDRAAVLAAVAKQETGE